MCVRDADSPVWFTPASPLDVPPGALVYYSVVPCDVVSRCSVLSCIAEAEGQARLPDAVSVSDFRSWLTAVPWTAGAQKSKDIDFSALCTAAKVADVLDDPRVSAWVESVSERLTNLLPGVSRSSDESDIHSGHEAAVSLSVLPHHVQSQVFAAAVAHSAGEDQQPYLHRLLDWLPRSFHATIVEAAITGKELTLQLTDRSFTCMDTIAALPSSPPRVLSLQLLGQSLSADSDWEPQHIARVLSHHSELTKLTLGKLCGCSKVHAAVAPALPALTALLSLSLGTPDAPFAEDSLSNLQTILHSVPGLVDLRLSIAFDEQSTECQRGAAAPLDDHQQRCLAATISPASALTSLVLDVHEPAYDQNAGSLPALDSPGLSLPSLSDLSMAIDSCQWASLLLHHLAAPLTSLTLSEGDDYHVLDDDSLYPDVFIGRLPYFRLQTLHVCPAVHNNWAEEALTAMLTAERPELMVLQQLRCLEFYANSSMLRSMAHAASPLSSAVPQLQSLTMTVGDSNVTEAEWATIVQDLCKLPLQDVSLEIESEGPAVSQLVALTGLTALKLVGCKSLATSASVNAMYQVTQLRCLHVQAYLISTSESEELDKCMQSLLPGLAELPGLTSLVISDHQVCPKAVAADEVERPWRALKQLGLFVGKGPQKEVLRALVACACTMPTLETLVIECQAMGAADAQESGGGDEHHGDLTDRERLQQTAKRSGLALSFKQLCLMGFPWQ